ncbi:MAG: head decoration protein [Thermodesulfovibrionia bacterium]|nr:head decoration protein [Thermodesulfovibrionia bacterium]
MKLTKREKRKFSLMGLIVITLIMVMGIGIVGVVAPKALAVLPLIGIALGIAYAEGNYLSDVLLKEADDRVSREKVTVISGQNLLIGAIVGKITKALGAITADADNTGNGTCTGVTMGADALLGTYTIECITAVENGGKFKVINPLGNALPDATVAVAYVNDQINFTVNDGATDFIVGDKFTIVVGAGSGKVTQLAPAAINGSQNAYGMLTSAIDASSADVEGVAIVRDAVLKSLGIVWPAGITEPQKAAALAELEAKLVTTREGV